MFKHSESAKKVSQNDLIILILVHGQALPMKKIKYSNF